MGARTTWLPGFESAQGAGVLDLRPAARARLAELEAALWDPDRLDPAITALVRDRVGQLVGVGDGRVDPGVARSPREEAALGFAEQYVLDPSGVTDEQCRRLGELFTEPELTALTFAVAVYDALARVEAVLGIELGPSGARPVAR